MKKELLSYLSIHNECALLETINFEISIDGETLADRTLLSNNLKSFLNTEIDYIKVDSMRDSRNTMDFGATLAVILGTASITALAKGVATWIKQNNGASITIKVGENTLSLTNIKSEDANDLIKNFLDNLPKQ